MKPSEIDENIKWKVKTIRKIMKVKPQTVAESLGTTRSNYHKMEKGTAKITPGQLTIIAKQINTTASQLLCFSEEDVNDFKFISLPKLIVRLVLFHQGYTVQFTSDELDFIKKIGEINRPQSP